ncbi:MAG: methyltransferase domain-containing protein [Okeania sp. SIO3C4]|nr:methyltransferase domain-containing protein [Okeania sp. SIO3C4]
MKTSNPASRYRLKINKKDRVLEVGGGHNPHSRSNVVVDKFVDSNYHRQTDIRVMKHQEFQQADGENLPFKNNEFDYVICNQVLEHAENPERFLGEQMRVAKRGYLETPSLIGEYLFPKESHKWLVLEIDGKLILMEKEKYWFNSKLDFGFLFLTWLEKSSLAFKVLARTRPNLLTVRYEWEGEVEFQINPSDEEVKKYFNSYWNEEMTQKFFPSQPIISEVGSVLKETFSILTSALFNKTKNYLRLG